MQIFKPTTTKTIVQIQSEQFTISGTAVFRSNEDTSSYEPTLLDLTDVTAVADYIAIESNLLNIGEAALLQAVLTDQLNNQ